MATMNVSLPNPMKDWVEAQVKSNFKQRVSDTHYGKNGYFFSIDWQGLVLAHGAESDRIGSNMWAKEDNHGTKLVQELITVSKSKNGGYVKYWWNKPDTNVEEEKITFVVGLKEWECYLATGVYLGDIEPIIASQQAVLNDQVKSKLLLFITFITLPN